MQSISVLFDAAKFADFQWKKSDFNRTQEVRPNSYIFWILYR